MPDLQVATPAEVARLRAACEGDFHFFASLLQGEKWFDEGFHGPFAQKLQDKGGAQDLLVLMARGHLKTTIGSILYPLWRYLRDHEVRVGIVSNSGLNAQAKLRALRQTIEQHPYFRALWPEIGRPRKRERKWTDEAIELPREGTYQEATFEGFGIAANVAGRHYTLLIEDDTVAPKKDEMTGEELMPSRDEIEKAVNFHKLTMPLLVPPIDQSERLFICTRWAFYDAAQHIIDHEVLGKPGGRFAVWDRPTFTEGGKPACPTLFSQHTLDGLRESLGPFLFSALYLNLPLHPKEMAFHPSWLRYFDPQDEVFLSSLEGGYGVVSVDPADPPTGKTDQCYTAIVGCLQSEKGLFVRAVDQGRVTNKQLIDRTLKMADRLQADEIRVEADRYAHLETAFRVAMHEKGKYYSVRPVKTKGRTKEARIMRLQPLFENGLVWLRRGLDKLENELLQFPHGRTVDIIDALAWQVMPDFRTPPWQKQPPKVRSLPNDKRQEFTYEQIMEGARKDPFGPESLPFPAMTGRGRRDRPSRHSTGRWIDNVPLWR
jgi:phage terminase large subunit-like protein